MNYETAESEFKKYAKDYDKTNPKINLKIKHSFTVVEKSEFIAKELGLNSENIELAKIIALLHDIGRLKQIKLYNSFKDHNTMDHGNYAIKILFEDNLIRNFVYDNKHDKIISKAIKNHNKYKIEERLTDEKLLHCKIIRDADKLDNYEIISTTEKTFSPTDKITNEVFNDFINHKNIDITTLKTELDKFIYYITWIFNINFDCSLKYIQEKNYINLMFDRFKFEDKETKNKIEQLRKVANNYLENKINSR